MTLPEKRIERLAESLGDDEAIDWSSVGDETKRLMSGTLFGLRQIESIARGFRSRRERLHKQDSPSPSPGFNFNRLKAIERIGRGAQGDVWKAYDPFLDRNVALKLHESAEVGFSARLRNEAKTLAKFQHTNIVSIYGATSDDTYSGIWTELVRGKSLAALVCESGPFSITDMLCVGITLCKVLHVVHQAGVAHCDVKLDNIMREDDGRLVIVDFGAARPIHQESALPVFGTPSYVAPELFADVLPNASSDVYALGVLLFRLVTGIFPYTVENSQELIDLHSRGEQCDVRALAPTLPHTVADALQQALQSRPAQRFANMQQFEQALTDCMAITQ
jgi:eukaryotic-like serine/threonine-protein kinase